jgi:hypothetical protein
MRELLVDCLLFKAKQALNEIADINGKMVVQGVLQRADAQNQNGRIYPFEVLQRESKKYEENFIKQKRAMGELDHPNTAVINLKNVSHNVSRVWWDGKDLLGEVEILTTPSGNILKELLKCGITLGVSSRGMGSLKKVNESTNMVEDDYALLCFDFVSDPSVIGAFLTPKEAINESKDNSLVVNPITNKWESVDGIIREILSEIK